MRAVDLVPVDRELVMSAVAALAWHESNPLCPRCGQSTRVTSGGPARLCPQGHYVFPRPDPAILTAVLGDEDRHGLARNRSWDPHGRSVVAGCGESGE
ncbi:NADH pyrophosphatase, partial [Bifidobacterium xylocopae]